MSGEEMLVNIPNFGEMTPEAWEKIKTACDIIVENQLPIEKIIRNECIFYNEAQNQGKIVVWRLTIEKKGTRERLIKSELLATYNLSDLGCLALDDYMKWERKKKYGRKIPAKNSKNSTKEPNEVPASVGSRA